MAVKTTDREGEEPVLFAAPSLEGCGHAAPEAEEAIARIAATAFDRWAGVPPGRNNLPTAPR